MRSSRTTTWNCRRAGSRISYAPNNIAIFAARAGWRKGSRVATDSWLVSTDPQCLNNERTDYESGSILRRLGNAHPRFGRRSEANGAYRPAANPLARDEILRSLRPQGFCFMPGLQSGSNQELFPELQRMHFECFRFIGRRQESGAD